MLRRLRGPTFGRVPLRRLVRAGRGHFEGCRRAADGFLRGRGEPTLLGHVDYTARSWVRS